MSAVDRILLVLGNGGNKDEEPTSKTKTKPLTSSIPETQLHQLVIDVGIMDVIFEDSWLTIKDPQYFRIYVTSNEVERTRFV